MPFSLVAAQLQNNIEPTLRKLIRPRRLSRVATRMPQALNRLVVARLLNKAFAEQVEDGDFDFLQQRQLQVEIKDAELFIGLSFNQGQLTCEHFSRRSQPAEATLSIDSAHAIQLVQQEVDPDTLFFQRQLKISGDTELAHQVKNTIDTLDPQQIPLIVRKPVNHYQRLVFI